MLDRDRALVSRLPKVELHLHLEGAIPVAILWMLVEKYGASDGLTRDFGPERGMRWLHELAEVRDLGIIGIGLGGVSTSKTWAI